jgi:endonuclease/exonuclease/phosphatase family metal-dependent hydrolase
MRWHALWLAGTLLLGGTLARADEPRTVRVANYNIRFLSARGANNINRQGDRLANLKKVIEKLRADVIGLEEIDNRAALELVFPRDEWHLVIDDDSGDRQDVALAVRKDSKNLKVLGFDNPDRLNADDKHFLFPGSDLNSPFPKRRDVLAVEVELPGRAGEESQRFFVMVHHAKARRGGRQNTEGRRRDASRRLVRKLERDFDEVNYILLGDFNDNPDDASLNILETGDPEAPGRAENEPGTFLINLTEPLLLQDRCSFGLADRLTDGIFNTRVPGSRARNNATRGSNARPDSDEDEILFDQLLIPVRMAPLYVSGSIRIFDDPVALKGTPFRNKPSDHLPVYADFRFAGGGGGGMGGKVRIASLLPNPEGRDKGKEKVTLRNLTDEPVNLAGMKLRDRAGNTFALEGSVPGRSAGGKLTLTLPAGKLPLNNDGDEVVLMDKAGNELHRVEYKRRDARSGQVVNFD